MYLSFTSGCPAIRIFAYFRSLPVIEVRVLLSPTNMRNTTVVSRGKKFVRNPLCGDVTVSTLTNVPTIFGDGNGVSVGA